MSQRPFVVRSSVARTSFASASWRCSEAVLGAGIHFLAVSFEHGIVLFFALELLGAFTVISIAVSGLVVRRAR